MLHEFLDANRTELIERCRMKVSRRPAPRPTPGEMDHGIPLFLGQLIETLRLEQDAGAWETFRPGGMPGLVPRDVRSEIALTAAKHGHSLLQRGYTVNQVVFGYGDLCQAITELAIEKRAPVTADEFQGLNRCLDNAIADAVTEFARRRDLMISERDDRATSERLGFLAHELRNFLNTAMLSFAAIKSGSVALDGATSGVLDRSFIGLRDLIDRALSDVRLAAGVPVQQFAEISVHHLLSEVQVAASLEAKTRDCEFTVSPVAPNLGILADRQLINSAVSNLLQNAFKFTRDHTHVSLKAYGKGDRVLIEIEDQCGGLPEGKAESLFSAFTQQHADKTGLGLGLSIARRAVEGSGGTLAVRDMPGLGCVFTIDLPRQDIAKAA
jgi:signal transduction histidine kinase